MAKSPGPEITRLLAQWRKGAGEGDEEAATALFRELRRLASAYLRHERPGHILQPTALVNEAYIRLAAQMHVRWRNRSHFFGVAAQMMRRVLVDVARRRKATKREGSLRERVTLSNIPAFDPGVDVDCLTLNKALSEMGALSARRLRIVELRYFGGLEIVDIAKQEALSPATVKRELTAARIWLRDRLSEA